MYGVRRHSRRARAGVFTFPSHVYGFLVVAATTAPTRFFLDLDIPLLCALVTLRVAEASKGQSSDRGGKCNAWSGQRHLASARQTGSIDQLHRGFTVRNVEGIARRGRVEKYWQHKGSEGSDMYIIVLLGRSEGKSHQSPFIIERVQNCH